MRPSFSLFQSHLDLSHSYWSQLVQTGDRVIDATCGNGRDTLKLCKLTLTPNHGYVYAFDIQSQAIDSARHYLDISLPPELMKRVEFQQRCHSTFPDSIQPASIKLIVYNLGYLPGGGDKSLTTHRKTTLESLRLAQELLQPGGVISVTCYPGHIEGALEQESILTFASSLSPKEWCCCHHVWLNRNQAPSLLMIQKTAGEEASNILLIN